MPAARAADAAASAFSTLKRDRPLSVIGTSTTSTSGSVRLPSSTVTQPSMTWSPGRARRGPRAAPGESGSREKTQGRAGVVSRIAKTRGSSALSTAQPDFLVIRGDHALDLGELVDGVDPLEAEVVGGHVGHHGDVVADQADALEQDAAARGLGDREVDLAWASTRPAPEGPE